MRYLLDTTVLIDHAQGLPAAVALVRSLFSEPNDLLICDVVVTEALSKGPDEEIEVIGTLIDALEYVAADPAAARWAGESRRRGGRTSPRTVSDAVIAGIAWSFGATVVTRNPDDFEKQGVRVLAYA
jgi:predicted nucleic acid-binding protein